MKLGEIQGKKCFSISFLLKGWKNEYEEKRTEKKEMNRKKTRVT